jgi:hypothetical protein
MLEDRTKLPPASRTVIALAYIMNFRRPYVNIGVYTGRWPPGKNPGSSCPSAVLDDTRLHQSFIPAETPAFVQVQDDNAPLARFQGRG